MLTHDLQVKEGKVIAVGPGRRANNGELIAPGVQEGDHVLMPDYGGQEVDLDGTKCEARHVPWRAGRRTLLVWRSQLMAPDVTQEHLQLHDLAYAVQVSRAEFA